MFSNIPVMESLSFSIINPVDPSEIIRICWFVKKHFF